MKVIEDGGLSAVVTNSRQEAMQAVTCLEDLPGTTNDEVQALLDL